MSAAPIIAKPARLALGAGLVLAAAFLISVQDVIIKKAGADMPLWQIFSLRAVIGVPLILVLAALPRIMGGPVTGWSGLWPTLRSLCIAFGLFLFYMALPFLSLSTAGAGIYLAPIFMALLSARFLGEPVGVRGWVGVCLGFAGALVLLRPGSDAFSAWVLLPVAGAAFYALGHIITRARCQDVGSGALALSYIVLMSGSAAAISLALVILPVPDAPRTDLSYLLGTWTWPGTTGFAGLAVLGFFIAAISVLLAEGYKIAPPSSVGTFEYSYLVFAIAWDVLFFGTHPDAITLAGIAMIAGAGILVLRRRV